MQNNEPALRTIAMPSDTNPYGDIFGGWLMSQMDMAGANVASRRAGGRLATVAVNSMEFHEPVEVGDEVSCYASIAKVGRTSITVDVTTYKRKKEHTDRTLVTSAVFTYVRIGADRRPEVIPPSDD